MSVYLHDIPLDQAQARFREALTQAGLWKTLESETIAVNEDALGRILAEPIWARLSSPHYHACAMDGFALVAEETQEAKPATPITLAYGTQAFYVDTGDALPDQCNAVVPIEQVEALDENFKPARDIRKPAFILLRASLPPWSYVRPMGEDIVATQLVLPSNYCLRAYDLGAVAASGHSSIAVIRKPQVAILPTGTELVPIGQEVKAGDIIEFNSIVLGAQVKEWGAVPHRYPITPDNKKTILEHVQKAANENDLVLLNAGSSAGSEDFSAAVVKELGELLVHGIAVRPGHPVILGMIRRTGEWQKEKTYTPIIGVPGYPVSAALTNEIFVEPLIALWLGRSVQEAVEISGTLTRKVTSPAGDDDYMRVVVGKVDNRTLVAPLSRGAGVITSLVRADGITVLPRGVQGFEAGSMVKVRLNRHPQDLENTIFAIGSHDMTLDLLAQFLSEKNRRLVSANVGSLGGLMALQKGEAHLAGSHLLDPITGEYNWPYIRQYLKGIPVHLVGWVWREQGLLVARGNPKNISSLSDLVRKDITFINRQRGAGTRVLLDYHLEKLGITKDEVKGYAQEEYTHLAVAAAVASGRADCGLGITAAAHALDLNFIPLFKEDYDLVIPSNHFESDLLKPLLDLMTNDKFRTAVAMMPGYDTNHMGSTNIVI